MGISLLGSLGAKLGFELVGSIMEKTLPNAMESMKKGPNALDRFESVVGMFGAQISKMAPANQFSLALPFQLSAGHNAGSFYMGLLSKNLGNFKSLMGLAGNVVDILRRFQPQQLDKAPTGGSGITPGGFGSGMNVDTQAMVESTGYGNQSSIDGQMGPMEMFKKMQEAQQAAQMFELAVKIADIQHQAAMSAIRGIRY
jgi:hypothetical protein